MNRYSNICYIEKLSLSFRNAIEKALQNGDFVDNLVYSRFPHGCCGMTSDLLAFFFESHNIKAKYVCGITSRGETLISQSHAWLLIDETIIVDITGDQFKLDKCFYNFDKKVFVGKHHPFYSLFVVDPEKDIQEYKDFDFLSFSLKNLYNRIIKYINL